MHMTIRRCYYSDNNASMEETKNKNVNEFNTGVVAAPKCRHMRDRDGLNLDFRLYTLTFYAVSSDSCATTK